MNLKTSLTRFFKDAPDEEEAVGAQHSFPSRGSQINEGMEKPGSDAGGIVHGAEGANEIDADEEHEDEDDELSPNADLDHQLETDAHKNWLRRKISRIFSLVCPTPNDEEEIQAYIPHYRVLPILSGIAIPFCILLGIPGLTEPWFAGSSTTASKPNPPFFDIGIGLGLLFGVLANVFLIIRFLEKRVKTMTILCIISLSIHDILNVAALARFGATLDGYMLGQAFWMTLCSTIVSAFTNLTLIIDFIRTADFKRSGSGLTRRQRSLLIIIIGLFCYIALGALINALLLDLTFINGLYFTVVTIETIGFGDIVPNSRRSRVFICFYATLGVINLAFVVGYLRETILEGIDFKYRKRLLEIRERRKAARRQRRAEHRWRHAVVWRLRQRHAPIWIPGVAGDRRSLWCKIKSYFWRAERGFLTAAGKRTHATHHHGMKLNLWALPPCQLEAAALEAGVPLDTLLPPDFYDTYDPGTCRHPANAEHHAWPPWFAIHPVYHHHEHAQGPLTQRRLGAMAAMLTKLSFSIYESGGGPVPRGPLVQDDLVGDIADSSGTLNESKDYRADVAHTERRAYTTRSGLSWAWFLVFWMGGAAIFKATEGWTFGLSVYFCFISFSTVGYGDVVPTTPAGRSIFVVWALIGVATMTIFISVISDAYTSRYKSILGRNSFKNVVQQYRKRAKVELKEKVERIGSSTGMKVVLRNTIESVQTDESTRASGSSGDDGDDGTRAVATCSKLRSGPDADVQRAQQSLEELPRRILTETQSIQQYMQLISDEGPSPEAVRTANETLWTLVDEVMTRQLPESTKIDILRDGESRQTLMMLGVERSLKELVDIAEQAIATVQKRDQIIATLDEGKDSDEMRAM